MDAEQVLLSLASSGFSVQAMTGRVIVRLSSRLTDHHRQLIRGHKAGLLELLTRPPPLSAADTADLAEAREERSAIAEFDGGLSREEADIEAQRIRAWSVLVKMPAGDDRPPRWITMICTGDRAKARRNAEGTFTTPRVLGIREGTR